MHVWGAYIIDTGVPVGELWALDGIQDVGLDSMHACSKPAPSIGCVAGACLCLGGSLWTRMLSGLPCSLDTASACCYMHALKPAQQSRHSLCMLLDVQ